MVTTTETTTTDYADLIATLSLREKVTLLTGASVFTMAGHAGVGLAAMNLSDGPTGVRGLKFSGGRAVTLFPNATLLSAAWSTETAREVGRLLAEEAQIQDIHVVLGPTINLHRSVLGGRLFEAYSEDPLLTGVLAAAYVDGLQSAGIGACLKHLVANESETDRNSMNSVVDEATLRELYLLPFEIAIEESNPWSLMAAYNDVNGQAATEQQHVNLEVVKGEWGYDGLLMSDWFATKTTAASANGGLDLVMPGPDSAIRREQLTRLAASGMTVLTNNGVLPLTSNQTVALVGRHAVETTTMGGGSAQVNPPYQVSVAEGLGALLGDRLSVTDGVEVRTRPAPASAKVLTHPETGQPGVAIDIFAADGTLLESRHGGLAQTMVGFDDELPQPAARVVFRGRSGLRGAAEVGGIGVGRWTIAADGASTSFELTSSGGIGAEMLSPPVHVNELHLSDDTDLVEAVVELGAKTDDNPLGGVGMFALVVRPVARPVEEVLETARVAAAAADVAIVVVGLTAEQETEAVDKSTLALPGEQDALVRAVAAAARRTVVVVNAATPVLMPWADEVDAILVAGLPGQEGGHAVAAALLGTIEPAGRLVTTFPAADGAAPAWDVVPTDGDLRYDEGTFIGYRGHYAGRAPAPAFWLGEGLGYSTWQYTGAETLPGAASPTVRVRLTNTGERESREVVQVYLDPQFEDQPVRLVGWATAQVPAGAYAMVDITTDARLWRRWDTQADSWGEPLTGGRLLVARGLGDIRADLPL